MQTDSHYELVEQAISAHANQPADDFDEGVLATELEISASHLQRVFKSWAGVTPKQFVQLLQKNHTLDTIRTHQNLLNVASQTGFPGPSRLRDFTVKLIAASPGEIKTQGLGLDLRWDTGMTPFGLAFCAQTQRGICSLHFLHDGLTLANALSSLRQEWPKASVEQQDGLAQPLFDTLFRPTEGENQPQTLSLWVKASSFRVTVWQALIDLPEGALVSYGLLASLCQRPKAARAVGTAVAANPVAWLIPCHRVIRETGEFGQYRWQATRKQAMHVWEQQGKA